MQHHTVVMDSIPEIKRRFPAAKDEVNICDVPGFCHLIRQHTPGSRSYADRLTTGDLALAEKSDKFIRYVESLVFLSTGKKTVDAVAGAFPNVPAFVSGSPFSMRARHKTYSATAPIGIFIELTGSAALHVPGPNGESFMTTRGEMCLALARTIANFRPVEIWVTFTYGSENHLNQTAVRIDTAPLDLARSALLMTDTGFCVVAHELASKTLCTTTYNGPGSWAYHVPELEQRYAGQMLARLVIPGMEIVYIPAGYAGDSQAILSDPVVWLKAMLRKYAGEVVED